MISIKKIFVVLIFVAALFSVINTAKADVNDIFSSVNIINGKAAPGEKLEYNVTLRNGGNEPLHLSLNILFTGFTDIKPNVFTLEPNEEKEVHILLTIKPDQKPGNILTKLFVFDEKGNSLKSPIFLQGEIIESPQPFKAVKITDISTSQKEINPKNSFNITFNVYNPIKSTTAVAEVSSSDIDNFEVYTKNVTVKDGYSTITLENLTLPQFTPIGNYTLIVKLLFSSEVYSQNSTIIHTKGYSSCDIKESENVTLLGKTYSAKVKNIGTVSTHCIVSSELFGIEKGLISTITEGYKFKGKNVEWNISMQQGSEAIVEYKISYIPLLVIPFIAIFAVGGFWYLTRKVTVKKEIVDYKRHPGFMDLKIQLRIKNLSGRDIKNIKIYDPLPAFIKEIRDYGTVPGKVITRNRQKVVRWDIDILKAKEERIFSYKSRTSVEVLGNLLFKPTRVEYHDKKGKNEETSNALVIEVK